MTKTKKLPSRDKVKAKDTWDLSSLYKTDADWERAFTSWEKQISHYENFRGTLGDGAASTVYAATPGVTLDLAGQTDLWSGTAEIKVSQLSSLADAVYRPFVPTNGFAWTLSPATDGAKIIYARFKDAAGNESAVVQGSIELWATPPRQARSSSRAAATRPPSSRRASRSPPWARTR